MAVLVVPGVCRFTVNAIYAGVPVATVLDYKIDTTGSSMSREDALQAHAGIILNEWSDSVLSWISNDYTASNVSYVDLDSADGLTGSRNVSGGHTWPTAGAEANISTPANVAQLWTKITGSGRGSRNGRMFLPGLPTTHIQAGDPRRMDSAHQTARQTNADSFLGDTNQEDPAFTSYQSDLVVVHVTTRDADGHPTAGVHHVVSGLRVEALLATQKRRQRP